MEQVRLQKFIASAGISSRRQAEQLILSGRVTVNGAVVDTLGTKITASTDNVAVDGKMIAEMTQKVYYLLNKPQGYVTTLSDPQGRPIVTKLLTDVKERIFPVGRLDFDTEGALLMTNDGELAQKVMHPSFETFKTYEATLTGIPSKEKISKIERGLMIDGKKTAPAKINSLTRRNSNSIAAITIHEGRKHQVKKMFAAIGHPVTHLRRIAYGRLNINNIKIGEYRTISSKEIALIFLKE